MIVRFESILAMLPPAIAVSWVIVDATMGMVSAEREIHQPAPVVQIVGKVETASAVDPRPYRALVVFCSSDSAVAAGIAGAQFQDLSQATVKRLCQAGLKFTSSLLKI